MARTYRRRGCRYDFAFVFWDFDLERLTMTSPAVRKRLARFHSDSFASLREPPPKGFRIPIDHAQRARNRVLVGRWLKYRDFDLLCCDRRRCPAWLPM